MFRKLRPRLSFANVTSVLALFVALGGTSAVALSGSNTVFSDDIANDNFNSPTEGQGGLVASDLRAGSVASSEVADGSLTGTDVFNNTIAGTDITNGSLTGADVFDNTIGGADITNNSLTGADINEATLSPTTTATFNSRGAPVGNIFNQIVAKTLPAGNYIVVAIARVGGGGADTIRDTFCELRSPLGGITTIASAHDGRHASSASVTTAELSMFDGSIVPEGGGEVSLWCRYDGGTTELTGHGRIMAIRLDGFF
jgi:hypothetical protein